MTSLKIWRKRLRALLRRDVVDRELDEELAFHLEMETRKHVAAGMSPEEARRTASLAFGGVVRHAEATKDARALAWLSGMSLDFRLGMRMLVRYPGLTVVGGLAIAFAICLGATSFELLTQTFNPRLPLPSGDRLVAILNWDASAGSFEDRQLVDYRAWREQLRTIEEVGAYRNSNQNLLIGGQATGEVASAEITASAMRATGVAPLQGRALEDADEYAASPDVAVIGYDLWQTRFDGGDVLGRSIRIGRREATIVGIMPEGYGFPWAESVWLPLRLHGLVERPREGPSMVVIGRLAEGASLEDAARELTHMGARMATTYPDTHEHLRPRAVPYGKALITAGMTELNLTMLMQLLPVSFNLVIALVVMLMCANVALLMFARAAARESELVVRSALGASRRRITLQLFAEALVLGAVGAIVGISAAGLAIRAAFALVEINVTTLPFWASARVSPMTLLYSCGLTLFGAAIAGVIPGLKVTRGLGTRLRETAAGAGGFRFGGLWTAIIVGQIALTIPFPLLLVELRMERNEIAALTIPVPDDRILTARIDESRDDTREPNAGAFAAALLEAEQRLEAEPAVSGVAFASVLPRMYHPYYMAEVDAGVASPVDPRWPHYRISSIAVSHDYLDVMRVPILAGRGFAASDVGSDALPIIVNESFVKNVLGGSMAVGRRVRLMEDPDTDEGWQPGPWHQIVGVIPDLANSFGDHDPKKAGIYQPVAPGTAGARMLVMHLQRQQVDAASLVRNATAAADPTLRVNNLLMLNEIDHAELRFYDIWFVIVVSAAAVILMLSLAGIYAVMSFTVSQRTREIGIRVALGASRVRVLAAIFRRPMRQLGLGVLAGGAVFIGLIVLADGSLSLKAVAYLLGYLLLMTLVCSLAWVVPTRRALAVQPGEALRID